jgi:hypothetical protein
MVRRVVSRLRDSVIVVFRITQSISANRALIMFLLHFFLFFVLARTLVDFWNTSIMPLLGLDQDHWRSWARQG